MTAPHRCKELSDTVYHCVKSITFTGGGKGKISKILRLCFPPSNSLYSSGAGSSSHSVHSSLLSFTDRWGFIPGMHEDVMTSPHKPSVPFHCGNNVVGRSDYCSRQQLSQPFLPLTMNCGAPPLIFLTFSVPLSYSLLILLYQLH